MAAPVASRNITRRWGAGTAAIARALIAADAPMTGVAIAETADVSQPRASQVLSRFSAVEAVRATENGYVGDRIRLLDLYRNRSRPRLAEPDSYWYSTRPMTEQAQSILDNARIEPARVAISADLAADLLAPWRHPTLTIVYTDADPASVVQGLVPAEGRADASIIVRKTLDTTLLAPSPPWPATIDGMPLVDPTQQWFDLLDLGGQDRLEGAERLREAILDRSLLDRE